ARFDGYLPVSAQFFTVAVKRSGSALTSTVGSIGFSHSTLAVFASKSTSTDETPSTDASAASTAGLQLKVQLMPSTVRSTVEAGAAASRLVVSLGSAWRVQAEAERTRPQRSAGVRIRASMFA